MSATRKTRSKFAPTAASFAAMPEAGLARELGLDYACLGIVANWAAGCGDAAEITMAEVLANVETASNGIPPLLRELVADFGS